jgi:steroid Delta-isomerase
VVAPEHVEHVVERFCRAESGKDRDTWLSLFGPDATLQEVGSPVARGIDALGAFFDASVAPLDLELRPTGAPIVAGDEAMVFLEARVGRGADRIVLDRVVDHFVFDGDGRLAAVRAFIDLAATRADPE